MSSAPYLSVIIPAYRQARTICDELITLKKFLATTVPSFEIILVIDGNDDQTFETVIQNVSFPEMRIECFAENQGKGAVVRHGFSVAQGQYIAFMDAGGDLHPHDLKYMLDQIVTHQADIVIGSKRHVSSNVLYPHVRRIYSYMYQLLNRALFQLAIQDTQVGMKLFRREVLQIILPLLKEQRFAFDLELLVVAHHRGFNKIIEAPITIKHRFSSSVNWRTVYQMLGDTLAIFYRSRILKTYEQVPFQKDKTRPPLSPILLTQKFTAKAEHRQPQKQR